MERKTSVDKRNKMILRLREQGLTLGQIQIIIKEKIGAELSREGINQIIKKVEKN